MDEAVSVDEAAAGFAAFSRMNAVAAEAAPVVPTAPVVAVAVALRATHPSMVIAFAAP